MSQTQTTPDFVDDYRTTRREVASMHRNLNTTGIRDVATTGLSSAQIDAIVFGTDQPYDGVSISDQARSILLVRLGGKWGYAALTIIP